MLGVGLTFVLLVSLLSFAAPVSAGPALGWGDETLPSEVNKILTPNEDVASLAVNGDTIYAAMGVDNATYKSTNAGETWVELSAAKGTTSFPAANVDMVAVAPDNERMVVMVIDTGTDEQVEYSTNGGSSWTNLGEPGASAIDITSIDVSPEAGGTNYIAVGGSDGGVPVMYVMKLAAGETWAQRAGTSGFTASTQTINAVKFSPSWGIDKVITVVSDNASDAFSTFQVYWDEAKKWNGQVTGYEDYGTGIQIAVTSKASALEAASIALYPDYLGSDDETRIAFVGLADDTATVGGVYRIVDSNQDEEVKSWTGATIGPVQSVAYNGALLLAGDRNDGKSYVSDSPLAGKPKFAKTNTYKQPSGSANVTVAFTGDSVVAAGAGDSGAFAVSMDDGYAFNDISLIDGALTNLRDVTPAMDNSALYLSADDGTSTSIWVKASAWKRVLQISDTNYIVRISPDDPEVVYVADIGGTDIYYSTNGGQSSWKKRPCYKLTAIVDMAVEDDLVAYAIQTSGSSKTTNGGASWGSKKTFGMTGAMISLASNGDILIGGSDGYVAWSTDGGSTYSVSEEMVGDSAGGVQVVADSDYETNGYIYASTNASGDEGIYRSKTVTDEGFSGSKGHGLDAGQKVTGMAVYDGVLYAAWTSFPTTNTSALERSLNPAAGTPKYSVERSKSGEVFIGGPQSLKVSDGVKLWAISSGPSPNIDQLYTLPDTIATVGPTMVEPAAGAKIAVNPSTGRAYDVTFTIERPDSKATKAELQISTDADFPGTVWKKSDISTTGATTTIVVGPHGIDGDGTVKAEFMPGQTYYWKVRVPSDGPFYSPYSETRSFTIDEAVTTPPVEITIPPAPEITVTVPDVVVEIPPTPAAPAPAAAAPAIPSYLLWTIIAIGAILIIALIVLIVRTRRVV